MLVTFFASTLSKLRQLLCTKLFASFHSLDDIPKWHQGGLGEHPGSIRTGRLAKPRSVLL
jgi:hypothetical protein